MKRNSIRRKLIHVVMLTCVTALMLACAGFIVTDVYLNDGVLIRNLQTLTKILASNSTASLSFGDHESAAEVLGALRVKDSIIESCIYDAGGSPFAVYKRNRKAPMMCAKAPPIGVDRTWHTIALAYPIILDGRRIGTIAIVSDVSLITSRLKTFAEIGACVIVLAIIAAFFMIAKLHQKITRPIVHLEDITETVWRTKDYSLRAHPSSADEAEEIVTLIHGFNDMLSEIERRDEAKNRNMEMILDSAGEGIFGLDADGVATFVNPSAARILGWNAADLVGKELHAIIHDASTECARLPISECSVCSVGMTTRISKTSAFRRSDGEVVPIEYDASAITAEDGERTGVVVTFRDITERLAVDRMKSEFVSTVSHELRTPLTSIRGALGLLGAGLLGKVGDKGQRMLDIAISNTDRLVRLINDILDIERMDAGRVELHRRLVDAHAVMTQSAEVMQAMADREGVTLSVEPINELLWIDSDRVVQLLTNLISNAVKFSPRGARVVVSGAKEGESFVLRVKDEGRGIPHDKLETVFERFKQVDASDSRDKGGTGLGLAICRSIATMHGGRIWADSVDGEGSVFQFTLPLSATCVDAENAASQPVERTILVCEEDRRVMPHLVEMIERHGMHTLIATSHDQLVARAEAARPDAVILDLMPSPDGWSVIHRLKANEATRDIPIIVATLHPSETIDEYAGCIAGWVQRPYDEAEVMQAITVACRMPTILVVEDDLDLARVMTASLESHGIRALHAATGRAAIESIGAEVPDLIVLDLILPEMAGFDLVEWLKRTRRLASIPLVVYSALEVTAAQQEKLRLGPTEFLTKSRSTIEEFQEHVIRLLCQATAPETEAEGAA